MIYDSTLLPFPLFRNGRPIENQDGSERLLFKLSSKTGPVAYFAKLVQPVFRKLKGILASCYYNKAEFHSVMIKLASKILLLSITTTKNLILNLFMFLFLG